MKSIVLCETNFVDQSESKMDEEKPKLDSGGTEKSEILKEPVSGSGWQENSVISSTTSENGDSGSGSLDSSDSVKKLVNGNSVKTDLNRVKSEPVDSAAETNVVNNNVDNSDFKGKVENDQACDSTEAAAVKVEKETESDSVTDKAKKENQDFSSEEKDVLSATVKKDEESLNGGSAKTSAAVEKTESTSVEHSTDGVFDAEDNKENEKFEPKRGSDSFVAEDENEKEGEGETEEAVGDPYSIHVSDCQSVSVQDEDASWSEATKCEEVDDAKEPREGFPSAVSETESGKFNEDPKTEEADGKMETAIFETPKKEETSLEEEKMTTEDYSYVETNAEPEPEAEPDTEMETEAETENAQIEDRPEDVVSESQEDDDSGNAIEIDEDPIAELKIDEESASETVPNVGEERNWRKRTVSEEREDPATETKRRKTEEGFDGAEGGIRSFVDSADEDADDPPALSNPPTPADEAVEESETTEISDLRTDEAEKDAETTKPSDENDVPSSRKKTNLEETIDMVATNQKSLPFLENLRGTLKNLTRSDLEELAVQKLCEVITERSSVGELRRRAQALEQDQEKWKEKVQSLTKQLREMEMVMKKYMSEVQKQSKEKNFQIAAPIRVTRSVGLQVSFLSNAGKLARTVQAQNQAMATISPQLAKQISKAQLPKTPLLPNSNATTPPNMRKQVTVPAAIARTILSPQKNLIPMKKPVLPKQGTNPLAPNRPIAPQPSVNNGRMQQQNQASTLRPAFKVTPPQQTGSRVIDLTDDDDKQGGQKALQPSAVRGPVRVVNHLQQVNQSPVNQNSRVFHLVPASTAGAGAPTQNRQIVIAASPIGAQNRHVVSNMPPLIFKGGNFVPASPQTTALVNQNVRPLAPKQFRHPAPLPQPPPTQVHRPNWKLLPPRPALKISRVPTGIVLSWNMNVGPEYEPIASYQLYAYQESNTPPTTTLWKKVGDVKALPLPMACTLTQFMTGHKYHFAVRAVDIHSRIGPFSASNYIAL